MKKNDELSRDQQLGKLQSEVHNLSVNVNKLFELIERNQPKPMSFNMIMGAAVSVLTVFALLFGSVIYIANSANAPMLTQLQVMNSNIQGVSNISTNNTALIQLSNQKMSGVMSKVTSNEETLQWLLFDENIPKQLTETIGRVNTLEMQVTRVVDEFHKGGK